MNANPNNSNQYLSQLADSNKDFVSVLDGTFSKEQNNEEASRNSPVPPTPTGGNRRRSFM